MRRINPVGSKTASTARVRPADEVELEVEELVTDERLTRSWSCSGTRHQHPGRAVPDNYVFWLAVGVTGKLEHDIELEGFAVAVPPASLALMTGAEVDLGAIRKGQLDLNNVVSSAGCALQWVNRDTSSPTHDTKSSRTTCHRMRISLSRPLCAADKAIG